MSTFAVKVRTNESTSAEFVDWGCGQYVPSLVCAAIAIIAAYYTINIQSIYPMFGSGWFVWAVVVTVACWAFPTIAFAIINLLSWRRVHLRPDHLEITTHLGFLHIRTQSYPFCDVVVSVHDVHFPRVQAGAATIPQVTLALLLLRVPDQAVTLAVGTEGDPPTSQDLPPSLRKRFKGKSFPIFASINYFAR